MGTSAAYTKLLFSSFPACPGPLQLHRQQQMSILWAHSCILSMTLQVNSGPIRAHRQIPPSVLGPYMGLVQFPYMCMVGPYEAHIEYIFMGLYIYMHLSYTMGPCQLYQGVCEIVMWALPSTMTQICIMGLDGGPGAAGWQQCECGRWCAAATGLVCSGVVTPRLALSCDVRSGLSSSPSEVGSGLQFGDA